MNTSAKWIIKNYSGSVNKMTKNTITQTIWVYTKELGMGIEPIYNSSAGCRLNDSATPALTKNCVVLNKNIVNLCLVLLFNGAFRSFSMC